MQKGGPGTRRRVFETWPVGVVVTSFWIEFRLRLFNIIFL